MNVVHKLPDKILFRNPAPTFIGYFALMKSIFIVDGETHPYNGRCDNLTYTSTFVTRYTKYHEDSMYTDEGIPSENFTTYVNILDGTPDFCIAFMACKEIHLDGSQYPANYYFEGKPSTLWFASTLIELLKNIREWSFMVEEPFNLDHPMALYSKIAIEKLNPPQNILDEIDDLPDMHLARYLKGDIDHRNRVEYFPQMSETIKFWFTEKLKQFEPKTTNQRLTELIVN